MMAERVNKNKRMYPIDELRREVQRYNEEMVIPGRAMGELNHPATADVDLERACHMVTDLYEDNNVFYGKSKVLSTPCGLIVRSLINDGVKVGMSSRALGTLEEGSNHNVVRNLKLVAIDCVADPSFPKAFVNGILESKQWVVAENGKFEECLQKLHELKSQHEWANNILQRYNVYLRNEAGRTAQFAFDSRASFRCLSGYHSRCFFKQGLFPEAEHD